jgi:4-amino-4-deoxy-L-arabinose transferase-like glycosyltransferase
MPTGTLTASAQPAWRRIRAEALVSVLAVAVFLGWLGSLDLWGKREQRLSAEAIDTIDHQHWLVAEIQGRPRLEKPPLPRWIIAMLMALTGRRDEWMVRLPGAACALATVALIYALGRRMGGRPVGLASALVLCSLGFFVAEMRQAGNDGPLALLTTLALVAAWHILDEKQPNDRAGDAGKRRVDRAWSLVFYAALGLGFLTKGPIILMLVSVTIIPYLIVSRQLVRGLRCLADRWGLLLFAAMAASWPMAVLRQDPNAWRVWLVEMSEKTGVLQTLPHRRHSPLAEQWPGMMLPWSLIAIVAVALPFLSDSPTRRGARGEASAARPRDSSPIWFAWWWAVGNLGIFSLWVIAKPNYYIPCMPGMALLMGAAWVRLAQQARGRERGAWMARAILQVQWVLLFVAAAIAPVVTRSWLPRTLWPWSVAIATTLAAGVVASARLWRRGGDAISLAPVTAACALGFLIIYGIIAPVENARRGHRELAQTLHRLVPPEVRSLRFFNEIDEGLWFYLGGMDLLPVPGSQPRYSTAYDLIDAYRTRPVPSVTLEDLDARRQVQDTQALFEWLDHAHHSTPYLLIRSNLYDRLARELSGRVTPLFRESGLNRNELVLLHLDSRGPVATTLRAIRR